MVTLLIGGQTYSVEMLEGDSATAIVDRINFFAKDDPLVFTERDPLDADTVVLAAAKSVPSATKSPIPSIPRKGPRSRLNRKANRWPAACKSS